ncbi:MAG TPA: HD-GYP domain-containing protein [Dehalococcoidia bacterium]|nr:HD-GYP domain-containing protein [Dehalococcoidia bacterium]
MRKVTFIVRRGQACPQTGPSTEQAATPQAVATAPQAHDEAAGPRWLLWPLVALVSLAGFALVAYGAWHPDNVDWWALLLLAALAALAERFDLSLYGDSRVSLAFVPIFASIVLFGYSGPAVVVPAAVVASALGARRPLYKTTFNFGALMLAGAASVLVLRAFGDLSRPSDWPAVLAPALLASGANFAVNSGLVGAAIALSARQPLRPVWNEHFRWLWPHYLVLGVLGLAIASAYVAMGLWGIAVFLAPPVMMRLSLKQYLDRTAQSVLQLRHAHDDLKAAHSQVTTAMDSLGRAYDGTLRSLVAALDARDSETRGHSERVADLTTAIALELGFRPDSPEWRDLQWGALLHDVGKIAVPDHVLRKPSALSDVDWETMRSHPSTGYEILRAVEFLAPAAEVVLAHHERYDGSGYPRGLAGDDIPLGARIFAVADAFDAMTSHRPYRAARPPEEALAEVLRNSGSQFDSAVVRAFLSVYQKRFLNGSRGGDTRQTMSETLKRAILEAAGLEASS